MAVLVPYHISHSTRAPHFTAGALRLMAALSLRHTSHFTFQSPRTAQVTLLDPVRFPGEDAGSSYVGVCLLLCKVVVSVC